MEVVVIDRLDEELARHLRPVIAPEDLWFRIHAPQQGHTVALVRWPVWAFAAAVAATIALFCFSLKSDSSSYLAKFAAAELARGGEDVQFRSADPAQIRSWIQANAGIDIPLPATAGENVKLIGASVFRNGSPMVCVTYRVGNQPSRLLVTRANATAPQHGSMESGRYQGMSLATWVMQGQTYTLASAPENARAGCVLCHVEGGAGKTLAAVAFPRV
jgi:hypothetical protein